MKTILAILLAAAIFQGCNGLGMDSNDPGTSRGNDTITTEQRYKDGPYDNTGGAATPPGVNNGNSPNDMSGLDTNGADIGSDTTINP